MARDPLRPVLHYLHALALRPLLQEQSDARLLERFCASHDEAAFAALVQRHGPMVLGVCRRILASWHDAEDCFQAVFLALAQKAASIRRPEHLAGWLHGVARRLALKSRRALRRRRREQPLVDMLAAREEDLLWRDVRPILDEEIARLPGQYRTPFVLCYLEGKTQVEAARQLGWPSGTIATRLTWARQRLQKQLTRRGVVLPAGALTVLLAEETSRAALPAAMMRAAIQAGLLVRAGSASAGGGNAALWSRGVLRAMTMNKVQLAVLLLAAGVIGAGVTWLSGYASSGKAPPAPPADQRVNEQVERLSAEIAALRKEGQEGRKEPAAPADGSLIRYQGKPVSYWLEQLRDLDPAYRVKAVDPLVLMAKRERSLVPILVASLRDEDQNVRGAIRAHLYDLDPPVQDVITSLLHSYFYLGEVLDLVKELDPEGQLTITTALPLIEDENARVRCLAAFVLQARDKSKTGLALNTLRQTLRKGLEKTSSYGRRYKAREAVSLAAWVLQAMGPAARPAVPDLVATLRSYYGDDISDALSHVDPESTATVPALLKALQDNKNGDYLHRCRLVNELGSRGTKARAAVPVLLDIRAATRRAVKDLKESDPQSPEASLFHDAGEALRAIDPEAAKKAGVPPAAKKSDHPFG